ncbi:unnamed protein product [Pseudo-nitzschia multistriata]|uniref:Leucine-rich repeat-containing N-terminal plant-type domain-containing protein n=1 Tax=Pseudo-nitzschia multistriata TaxID=183589 RepID=A0A448YVS2_9STRA|nr:unnamed protein product [Pseudo-nitzschia multistriata]
MTDAENMMNDLQLEDVEDYSADYPVSDGGYPNAGANMAPAGNIEQESTGKSPKYRRAAVIALIRNNKWSFAVLGVVVVILIAIIASTAGGKKPIAAAAPTMKIDDAHAGFPPVKQYIEDVDKDVLIEFKTMLDNTFTRHNLDTSVLDTEGSPAQQAMIWMCKDKKVNSMEHTEKLQRYVLAVFFYSTNMVPSMHVENPLAWKNADNWMTNAHSCEWMGVECNEDKFIVAIYLEKNRLSGKIPVEIAIIANNIESLDFTDNIMHMRESDFDAFLSLKKLHTLLMDDNYLYNNDGLPSQMGAMTSMEKMRLSYNVFEGELNKNSVLDSMKGLTHLEIESNYFTGGIPNAILEMENLTYLYLRRNNMEFNLNFLKENRFTENIFAMWLDGNDIYGTIPTEIGLLSGLASFSMANATITGTIPTQIGNLSQLRRLWLFNNQLTGTIPGALNNLELLEVVELHGNDLKGSMPEGVCLSVEKSDYEFKSLTSDCVKEVTCDKDCCTKCF